ncbi:hypothetical protein ACFVH6_25605 [Spirillospora sp. NPDC127200]
MSESDNEVLVEVFHNVTTDERGRHVGWYDGYEPGHQIVKVFEFVTKRWNDPRATAEAAWLAGNTPWHEHSMAYRKRGLRDLMKGDVARIENTWLACATVGWQIIESEPDDITDTFTDQIDTKKWEVS